MEKSKVAIIVNCRPDVPARVQFYLDWVEPSASRQGSQLSVMAKAGKVGALRNEAALQAPSTDWILFLDDDKVLCCNAIDIMLDAARASGADLVYCDYLGICHPGSEHPNGPVWRHRAKPWSPEALKRGNYIDTTTLLRRSLYEDVGGWDEDLDRFLDWDLWLRCAQAGAVGFHIPDVLFHAHYLPGPSITRDVDYAASRRRVVKKHAL